MLLEELLKIPDENKIGGHGINLFKTLSKNNFMLIKIIKVSSL